MNDPPLTPEGTNVRSASVKEFEFVKLTTAAPWLWKCSGGFWEIRFIMRGGKKHCKAAWTDIPKGECWGHACGDQSPSQDPGRDEQPRWTRQHQERTIVLFCFSVQDSLQQWSAGVSGAYSPLSSRKMYGFWWMRGHSFRSFRYHHCFMLQLGRLWLGEAHK